MKVVVTGGSGRVGRYVVAELSRAHDVVNADLVAGASSSGSSSRAEFRALDMMDLDALRGAFVAVDVVVHLAAIDYDWRVRPEEYIRINTLGAWNVLQSASECHVKRVVICSSVAALGLHDMRPDWTAASLPVDDTHEARPVDSYGVSKLIVETMGRSFDDGGTVEVVCLRPCTVVYESNLAEFADAVDGGPYLCEYVTGEDVATAFRAAVEADAPGFGPYLLSAADSSHPEPTTQWYQARFGSLPGELDENYFARDPRASPFSSAGAAAALGWLPTSSLEKLKNRSATARVPRRSR